MGVRLLGPVVVDGGDGLRPRDRVALTALAVRRGRVLSVDQLADAMWGDDPPASWPKQVQICIARLRKVLGAAAIETMPGGYRLVLQGDDVDVDQFEQLIERGRTLAATNEPDRAALAFARALGLWRGTPYEIADGWSPATGEAARLEELRRSVEEDLLDARLAAGEHREVAVAGETLVAEEPLRERRWAILALAQYRCGRQADALRSLRRARGTLVEQLGIEPGAELVELESAILQQDAALDVVPAASVVADTCPYKGLAPYDVDDADSFFGRGTEVSALLDRLRSTSLLVVAGPSGSGKSSLVRAGLVPALQNRGRSVVVFVPGSDPFAAMSDALAAADVADPVVVIDQFEEMTALGTAPDVVTSFAEHVAEYALGHAPVVIVVRIDQLAGLTADPSLSRLAERGLHLVSPLAGDDLRAAIEGPADQAGLRLEHGLVDVLVRDVEGEPGALPLMSHCLVETWRRRDGHVLTLDAYTATGGIRGAVARSADRLHDSLPADQRPLLRSILLRLVSPSLDSGPIRCRVASRTLLGDPGRERVIGMLLRSRLITSTADTFELAHEALARAWPRLQSWLEDDVDGQRILRHLATAADGWEGLGRPASELYRGARLDTALEWRDTAQPDLTDVEREFVDASAEAARSERRALTERAEHEARQNRRLRMLLVASATLLVAALIAGMLVFAGRKEARDQRDAAQRSGRLATARELAAASVANLSVDPERSTLLALDAVNATREADGTVLPEAEEALHRAVTASRIERRVDGVGRVVDWSSDGRTFVAEGPESSGVVDIRDAVTGSSVRSWTAHEVDITDVVFNGNGAVLGTAGKDGSVKLWDVATGELLHTVHRADGVEARGLSFSRDGTLLAAAWPEQSMVTVIDVTTGDVLREISSVPVPVSTSFGPTPATLAVASGAEPKAMIVDVRSGQVLHVLEGHFHPLQDIEWSPDGKSIATGGDDSSVRVFDADTGEQRFSLLAHVSHVAAIDWSPDSKEIATASADGTVKVWTLIEGGGRELLSLSAQDTRSGVDDVSFSPDGTEVVVADASASATTIWNVGIAGGAEIANFPTVSFFYSAVRFTPDRDVLLSSAPDGGLDVWDASTFRRLRTIGAPSAPVAATPSALAIGADDVTRIAADPQLQFVAAAREFERYDGVVHVWDIATGAESFATRLDFAVNYVAWSPDGGHIAVAGGNDSGGVVAVFDRSGRQVATRQVPDVMFDSVSFTADGLQLVGAVESAGRYDPVAGRIEVWDWTSGRSIRTIAAETSLAVLDPTGTIVASAPHQQARAQVVEVFDLNSGDLLATMSGHTGAVIDVTFDPTGTKLATASADGTTRLWNARSGVQELVLRGYALTTSVSFAPDGSRLATAGADGVIHVDELDLDGLIALAQKRTTRQLTDEECRQYLHVGSCDDSAFRSP